MFPPWPKTAIESFTRKAEKTFTLIEHILTNSVENRLVRPLCNILHVKNSKTK